MTATPNHLAPELARARIDALADQLGQRVERERNGVPT